jgi:tRNA 2-thiouridine synthesizing protein B
MLYTVNKSPTSSTNLASLLRIAPAGAPILLYEDGVYAALASAVCASLLREALAQHPVYALGADLKARGIVRPVDGVRVIGYDGFVELVEQHDVVPWL